MEDGKFFDGVLYGDSQDLKSRKQKNKIEDLMEFDNVDILPIYLIAKDKTRVMRQLTRENNPDVKEIVRRFSTDEDDFSDITIQGNIAYKKFFEDQPIYVVENESQNIDDVARTIQNLVSSWAKKDEVS